MVGGARCAVLTVVLLLLGASAQGLWAVLFAAAVVAARLLPYTVVDVPDQALLDLDRLAVTAWSAREQPRGSRRRAASSGSTASPGGPPRAPAWSPPAPW